MQGHPGLHSESLFEKKINELNETKPPNQIRTRKNISVSISSHLASVWAGHPEPTLLPAISHLNFMAPCYSEGLRVGLVGPGVTSLVTMDHKFKANLVSVERPGNTPEIKKGWMMAQG